nr:MAG TPA: hypothetical protein [Caudoviricetes sp.]
MYSEKYIQDYMRQFEVAREQAIKELEEIYLDEEEKDIQEMEKVYEQIKRSMI